MDKDSMQSAVIKLIEKYIPDRNDLKELIKEDTDSVKYILAEIDIRLKVMKKWIWIL